MRLFSQNVKKTYFNAIPILYNASFSAKNQQFGIQPIHRQSNQQSHHTTKAIQPESINQKSQWAHSKNLHAPHVERICRD